jgi:hypothetical protein
MQEITMSLCSSTSIVILCDVNVVLNLNRSALDEEVLFAFFPTSPSGYDARLCLLSFIKIPGYIGILIGILPKKGKKLVLKDWVL